MCKEQAAHGSKRVGRGECVQWIRRPKYRYVLHQQFDDNNSPVRTYATRSKSDSGATNARRVIERTEH
jgi:hypothetical protein